VTAVVAGNGLAFIGFVLAVVFVVAYHRTSRGAWRNNPMGRHMMAFAAIDSAVLGLSVVRALGGASLDTGWFVGLRVLVFVGVPWVFGWRLWLLRSTVRAERDRQQAGGSAADEGSDARLSDS
jgi:hypothetical protein